MWKATCRWIRLNLGDPEVFQEYMMPIWTKEQSRRREKAMTDTENAGNGDEQRGEHQTWHQDFIQNGRKNGIMKLSKAGAGQSAGWLRHSHTSSLDCNLFIQQVWSLARQSPLLFLHPARRWSGGMGIPWHQQIWVLNFRSSTTTAPWPNYMHPSPAIKWR